MFFFLLFPCISKDKNTLVKMSLKLMFQFRISEFGNLVLSEVRQQAHFKTYNQVTMFVSRIRISPFRTFIFEYAPELN